MATEFLMPKLGLTMEEGTIAEWLVADGQSVEAGTAVLRIETDKTEKKHFTSSNNDGATVINGNDAAVVNSNSAAAESVCWTRSTAA